MERTLATHYLRQICNNLTNIFCGFECTLTLPNVHQFYSTFHPYPTTIIVWTPIYLEEDEFYFQIRQMRKEMIGPSIYF